MPEQPSRGPLDLHSLGWMKGATPEQCTPPDPATMTLLDKGSLQMDLGVLRCRHSGCHL